jgi:hypothetical protein
MDLREADGITTLTWKLAFRDQAGRDHMTKFDGILESFDRTDALLRSLLGQEARPLLE